MNYARDYVRDGNTSNYRSVNTLIQPKKYNGISVAPPTGAKEQTRKALEIESPLGAKLSQEGAPPVQAIMMENSAGIRTIQPKENQTGMPNHLKAELENHSGLPMDDVRVHYNSDKPAQIQALAYTQGTDIYMGPGQENHLPHEGWHVVQQKQGRVKPALQWKGMAINDDVGLEREADERGRGVKINQEATGQSPVIQRTILADIDPKQFQEDEKKGRFPGAREYIQDYEIGQSAQILHKQYKMDEPLSIKSPQPSLLNKSEVLILVGHGGGGKFMGMEAADLQKLLLQWGVTSGMEVALAGCETAEAKEAIEVIRALTGKAPIVNQHLAYTSKSIGEFIVDEKDSKGLYQERNDKLGKVTGKYVADHKALLLKTFFVDITSSNYLQMKSLAEKFYKNLKIPQQLSRLDAAYSEAMAQKIKVWWAGTVEKMAPKLINRLQDLLISFESKESKAEVEAYEAEHQRLVREAITNAKKISDEFIETMQIKLKTQKKDYRVEAIRGSMPDIGLPQQITEDILGYLP
ncbi:MAG TPA: DUF4157 domain-containing protein [Bacillota bacterium]|nr:DUF4157 domain-containing protein [Bacillota bacterium]